MDIDDARDRLGGGLLSAISGATGQVLHTGKLVGLWDQPVAMLEMQDGSYVFWPVKLLVPALVNDADHRGIWYKRRML